MTFTAVEIGTRKLNATELTSLRSKWDRPSHRNKLDLVLRKIAFENFSRNIVGTKTEEIKEIFLRLASL